MITATIRNYGKTAAKDVPLTTRGIRYSDETQTPDPTRSDGEIETQPVQVMSPSQLVAKSPSFQVFIPQQGTHAIEARIPEDALPIDNVRNCTLPLTNAEKVLVIDGSRTEMGGYHITSVLNPGSQVEIGAIPETQPPSFLRSATLDTFAPYRAVYLVDVPQIGENAANALTEYVKRGGGLALFVGADADVTNYNQTLHSPERHLLPRSLREISPMEAAANTIQRTFNSVTLLLCCSSGRRRSSLRTG